MTITVATFPIKTSSTSKLMAVATNSKTGVQTTANFASKNVGTSVTLTNLESGTRYKVELIYISTKGELKTLESKEVLTPLTTAISVPSNNNTSGSANVQIVSCGSESKVRVYVGNVNTSPSPTPSKSSAAPLTTAKPKATPTSQDRVRVYIGKARK